MYLSILPDGKLFPNCAGAWDESIGSVGRPVMIPVKGVAHFCIPVSDLERSTKFYTEIMGCRYLSSAPAAVGFVFLDAGGVSIILVRRKVPVPNPEPDHNGVHHAFMFDSTNYPLVLKH